MNISNYVMLLGGVALFLFGMSLMGDGLKKVAGNKLEVILYKLSGTPLRGIFLGMGVTAVIQSSSATSVMVVGFVNSKMMQLKQAISVIMGSIIGTSITGWIICLAELGDTSGALSLLSTETISAIAAIIGILLKMTAKNKRVKQTGDILLGFAVLMFGMKTMSSSVMPLRESPAFIEAMVSFSNPFLGIIIGMLFTAVLQSASAAVGILQALSVSGAITFEIALPLILGIAIGASVPVMISATGSTTEGRRAAFSYPIVEILRVILFGSVFYLLNAVIGFKFMDKTMDMVSIAILNTVFRVTTITVLIPFIGTIEKLLIRIVKPQKDDTDTSRLEERFLSYPQLAVEQTRLVMNSMAQETKQGTFTAIKLLEDYSEKKFDEVDHSEQNVDKYEDKIGSYLSKLSGRELTTEQNAYVGMYLKTITDLERISDHAMNIAESAQEISEKKITLSPAGERDIVSLKNAITEIISVTMKSFIENRIDTAYMVEPLEQVIDEICRRAKAGHIARLRTGECTISNGYVFNDLLTDFERISDHCSNIAAVVIESKNGTMNVHSAMKEIRNEHLHSFDEFYEVFSRKYLSTEE